MGNLSVSLDSLQSLEDYQIQQRNIFPSRPSIDWFVRVHKKELIEAGALVLLTGKSVVNPTAFSQTVLSIGQRTALARLKSSIEPQN